MIGDHEHLKFFFSTALGVVLQETTLHISAPNFTSLQQPKASKDVKVPNTLSIKTFLTADKALQKYSPVIMGIAVKISTPVTPLSS